MKSMTSALRVFPRLSSGTPGERGGGEGTEPVENIAPLQGATNPLTPALSPRVLGEGELCATLR